MASLTPENIDFLQHGYVMVILNEHPRYPIIMLWLADPKNVRKNLVGGAGF
jgi:hypothetical protein